MLIIPNVEQNVVNDHIGKSVLRYGKRVMARLEE
jgi:hypothetical protein